MLLARSRIIAWTPRPARAHVALRAVFGRRKQARRFTSVGTGWPGVDPVGHRV